MQRTRRDILLFMGGGAAGAMLTPAPWRLVTDAAIWSENWPGIPRPATGEITSRYTNCALCPAGCAVRARCVAGQPVSLAGVAGHPRSHGALCAFGLTGHHLPYHPHRLKQGVPEEAAAAVAGAMAKCGPQEKVAVLDPLPGRSASSTYQRAMAALKNGLYLAPPRPAPVDLSTARTVLSLGAPLLDGWGTPGNVHAARSNFRLIQAEPWESPTAALADEWLPILPGSEAALALALEDPSTAPAAAQATGLSEKQIGALATELRDNAPSLVLGRTDDRFLSSVSSVADNSIRVLFIDESVPGEHLPWSAIEKKLVRDNPVVVAFAWSRDGYARHAQFALPTAVYPELTSDIPPAIDSPVDTFRISTSLIPPPAGTVDPCAFLAKLAGIDPGNPLEDRANAIYKSGRGTIFTPADGKSTLVKDLKFDAFWKSLNEGATWLAEDSLTRSQAREGRGRRDAEAPRGVLHEVPPRLGVSASESFPLVVALTAPISATLASPLMSKLYQDSDLRLPPNTAALHPDTARASGLEGATRATLQTEYGACAIALAPDSSVPPGMLAIWPGPEVLDICGTHSRAKVVAA